MSAGNVVVTRDPGPVSPPDASLHRVAARLPLLAVLAGLGAASMNLVLSSLPHIQEVFGVDYHTTQSLLTAFLAGAAMGQLGAGPLADAYDRRTMLCLALGVFIAGSATAALAPTLAVLAGGRFLQGLGGAACLVLAEAIVARRSTGVTLARRIGLLNAGMAIAIMLAPLAGTAVAAMLGWRGLFWAPAVAGLALLMCASRLPREATTRDAIAPVHLLDGMGRLLRSRRFLAATLAAGFVMANYFCLAAFGPYIAMTIHGLDGVEYSLLFAAFGLSYIAGNIASGRLYARYGERRVVVAALVAGLMVGAFGLVLALIGAPDQNAFLAVGVIIATSTGLTLPSATSRSLRAETDAAGAAAGLFNFAIFGIGGLVTHIVGDYLDQAATLAMAALPLVTLIALLAVLIGYGRNAEFLIPSRRSRARGVGVCPSAGQARTFRCPGAAPAETHETPLPVPGRLPETNGHDHPSHQIGLDRQEGIMNAQVRQLNVEVRGRPTPAYRWSDEGDAANDCRASLALVRRRNDDKVGFVADPRFDEVEGIMSDPEVDLLGLLPPLYPERLGDPGFLRAHHCRFAYAVGEMARGIATPAMVIAAAREGMLGFHGSAGLSLNSIEAQIGEIKAALGEACNWGANLIANVDHPEKEMETADLFLRLGVRRISASAFLKLTPAVVKIAAKGLTKGPDGKAVRENFVFAKVSRPEVAEAFLSPAPKAMLDALVAAGHLTADEAELAATIPVASDLTVEADSGGHTDNRPLTAIFPSILRLCDDLATRHGFVEPTRVGAAGGLGTPAAVAAAFQLGAAYVVTGSVNQATPESGLCEQGKAMLTTAGVADVAMAPAADMFELGIKVQVLKRGSIFAAHANKLYDLYRRHDSLEALPAKDRDWLEKQILKMPVERAWAEVRAYQLRKNNPEKVAKAEADPKLKMAMVFRRHLFLCSQWARDGNDERKADYQIWCGPAMGAFNDWVRGSFLESLPNRGVAQIGKNLLEGAAIIQRAQQLRAFGLPVRADAFEYRPRLLA